MKRSYLVAAILLLSVWAIAQSPSSAQQLTPQGQSQAMAGDQSSQAIEGCIAGSGGSFTLTDGSGKTYQLTGDTAKLPEHVGHTLRIWGTEKSAAADPPGGSAPQANAQPTFSVQKVKLVSTSCPTSK